MQPYQCSLQLIKYVGLYGTLPYVTNLLASLWLAKAYVVPAGMYGAQVFCAKLKYLDIPFEFLKRHPRCEAVCT